MPHRVFSAPLALLLALLASLQAFTATPPPDQLIPEDATGILTIPDLAQTRKAYGASALLRLWDDPSMKPFREHVMKKLETDIIAPLEKDLGIKLADYIALAQGQLTAALFVPAGDKKPGAVPEFVVVLDAGEKKDELTKRLAEIQTKLADSGQKPREETIRGAKFIRWTPPTPKPEAADPAAADKADPKPEPTPAAPPADLLIGQSGSLLLLGNTPKSIERVLVRQAGGEVKPLAEHPTFAADYRSRLRDNLLYGWVHLRPLITEGIKDVAEQARNQKNPNPMMPSPDKLLQSLGIAALNSVCFGLHETAEGSSGTLFINLPEAQRKGVFKVFQLEPKDSAPPAFAGRDITKFSRTRIDIAKSWATLEATLQEVAPQMGGILAMSIAALGKDKDPNFDFKKTFIQNLGDDVVTIQKLPRGTTPEQVNNPPALTLLGCRNTAGVLQGLRAAGALLPTGPGGLAERDFRGTKVYSLPLPPTDPDSPKERVLELAAKGDYVAFSTDPAALEEYLRAGDTAEQPLRSAPGLAEAAQKVGGFSTGFFTYENARETARVAVEFLKKNNGSLSQMLAQSAPGAPTPSEEELKSWADFSLLPAPEAIARFFHFTVVSGVFAPEGIQFKFFSPQPPEPAAAAK